MQRTHYNTNFKKRRFPITLVGDNVSNASNIGSLFRISDAFGIEKLILCGESVSLGRKMLKTSRATEKVVRYDIQESVIHTIKTYKGEGYKIIALEITMESEPLHQFKFSKNQPIVLVVGDENFGVSDAVLKLADAVIHIDMYGQNSSMNVVQATNIALYEITKQLL